MYTALQSMRHRTDRSDPTDQAASVVSPRHVMAKPMTRRICPIFRWTGASSLEGATDAADFAVELSATRTTIARHLTPSTVDCDDQATHGSGILGRPDP